MWEPDKSFMAFVQEHYPDAIANSESFKHMAAMVEAIYKNPSVKFVYTSPCPHGRMLLNRAWVDYQKQKEKHDDQNYNGNLGNDRGV